MAQRGKIYRHFENRFRSWTEEEKLNYTLGSANIIDEAMSSRGSDFSTVAAMVWMCAQIGTNKRAGKTLSSAERKFAKDFFSKFIEDCDVDHTYEVLQTPVDEKFYSALPLLITEYPEAALHFFLVILSFALVDGVVEDDLAQKLETIFAIPLMVHFSQSGLESVPDVEESVQISLTDLEAQIVEFYQKNNSMQCVDDIAAALPSYNKSSLVRALNSLCDKGVLKKVSMALGDLYSPVSTVDLSSLHIAASNKKRAQNVEEVDYRQRQAEERRAERELEKQMRQWEREERAQARREREEEENKTRERNAANAEIATARREYLKPAQRMLGGSYSTLACVKSDGTVNVFGFGWAGASNYYAFNTKAVVTTDDSVAGLYKNGTCWAITNKPYSNERLGDVKYWSDIQELAAGDHHVVGLTSDGTCVATSVKERYYGQSDVGDWSDIVAIACGSNFTIGLRSDGTVVYTGDGKAKHAADWKDIALISAKGDCAVGITRKGEVVRAGNVDIDSIKLAENIVQISIYRGMAYALQADGTVVGGSEEDDEYSFTGKRVVTTNAVAMTSSDSLVVLTSDGYVEKFECIGRGRISDYRLFQNYDNYINEMIATEKAQKERREANICQHCGGIFKRTLFGHKCTQCNRKKDY